MAKLTAARAILYGTLTVAFLDGLYAVIVFGIRGVRADRVFQGIAAGLLGRDAFRGGLTTAGLGLALHVFIALVVVVVYYAVSARMRILRSRPLVYGPIYGVLVYAVMNLIVIPLSAGGGGRYSLWPVLGGLMIHVLGVGLPAAYFAAAHRRAPQPAAPSLPTAPPGAGSRSQARVR
jgi:hypothetical protein